MSEPATPEIRASLCPVCSRLSTERFRPFCSRHCADVDLARWFNGVYAVPVREEDEAEAASLPMDEP